MFQGIFNFWRHKMKKAIAISLKLFLAAIVGIALCIPVAQAGGRGNNGAGSLEFNVPLIYTATTTIDGSGATAGATATIYDALNMGFGMGYNFTDNFQMNGQFTWAYRNYATKGGANQNYNGSLNTSSLQLNAVYYFMSGDFTPFVTGGFGTTYVDTGIPDGTGSGGCYYDPWWGYVCYNDTKSSSNISYGAGIGARMDVSRGFAIEGSLNRNYIDANNASTKPSFDSVKFNFIFRM
jgi:opacity protein-like surface antigen